MDNCFTCLSTWLLRFRQLALCDVTKRTATTPRFFGPHPQPGFDRDHLVVVVVFCCLQGPTKHEF